MTLRVDVDFPSFGDHFSGVLEISGSDGRLSHAEAEKIQRARIAADAGRLPFPRESATSIQNSVRVFESTSEAIDFFISLTSDVHGGLSSDRERQLVDLLYSGEALVPSFNSPPSAWVPLRNAAEQASAIGIGVTWGGSSIPALLGAYIGGIFLVKFVTPVVAEAGNATAAGVGTKIRAAFGVAPSLSPQTPAEESASDPASPPETPTSGAQEGSG
ncbi:hypothetical protein AB5J55_14755 [Streptomyces sp. R11]|uniref:Uncharacterized protein n=1 Tax=Streptomyces sp. R11 TaxID=3238625 RepID=A0AB39MYG9_9ACTN